MDTPNQPDGPRFLVGRDGRVFPFPSLAFEHRLTVAPAEVASILDVPIAHIATLIQTKAIETGPGPIVGSEWIDVIAFREFLSSRIVGVGKAQHFYDVLPYATLKAIHAALARSAGEAWDYAVGPDPTEPVAPYFPSALAIVGPAALTVARVCEMLLFFTEEEHIKCMSESGWPEWAVDLRLPGTEAPLYRVPVETYRYWVRSFLKGRYRAVFLLQRMPEEITNEIYRELGELLGGKRIG